jgi:hypothetical protein
MTQKDSQDSKTLFSRSRIFALVMGLALVPSLSFAEDDMPMGKPPMNPTPSDRGMTSDPTMDHKMMKQDHEKMKNDHAKMGRGMKKKPATMNPPQKNMPPMMDDDTQATPMDGDM